MMGLKRILLTILLLSILAVLGQSDVGAKPPDPEGINVLFLMSRNFGVNYFLDCDRFEEYGWSVTYASLLDTVPPCPFYYNRYQVKSIVPDILIKDIDNLKEYDVLTVSSSSAFASPIPFDEFLGSAQVRNLVAGAVNNGLATFTVCHGSRLLAAADVINGKQVICNPKWNAEIEAAGGIPVIKDHPPVIAGNIVTGARGQSNNVVNNQAVATVVETQSNKRGPKSDHSVERLTSNPAEYDSEGVLWAKTFGSSAADGARDMCETKDGGYLVVGYSFSAGIGDADMLAVKVDSDGNQVWAHTYGGVGSEYAYGCAATADGFLIAGYTTSFGAGSKDMYLVKIDAKGNEVWSKTFGGESWDVANDVCVTSDGHYLICGFTHSSGAGEEDIYLVKTDTDGNEVWSRVYGGQRSELGYSVDQLSDGNILIGASTGTFGPEGNTNAYQLRLDADGNELWSRAYGCVKPGSLGFDWCRGAEPTPGGGTVLVGYSDIDDLMNVYVVRTDDTGTESWSKTFGNSKFYDFGHSIAVTTDGGFVVGGTSKLNGTIEKPYNNQFYLVKLSAEGEIAWQRVIGGPDSDWGSVVLETKDGNFLMAGHTLSAGAGRSDAVLLKINGQAPPEPPPEEAEKDEG